MKAEKGKKGFTLAELLIVVAIIGILLAIAIPNVISYYRSLKLTELDDSARTIFVAAQNRLTAMKSAGENLNALCSGNITVALASGGSAEVGTVTNKEKLDALVLGGSIEAQLHENHYVVEIDPKTGAVFAVWYWEKDGYTYKNANYGTADMTRDKRLEAGTMVGYYGGDKVDRLTFKQMPFPNVKLINAEELRVEITVPDINFGATVTGYEPNVLVDVLVNGVEIVKDANLWPDNDPGGSRVGTVVLDTLKTGGVMPDDVPYKDNFNPTTHTSNSGNSGWTYGMQYKDWETAYPDFNFPEPGEELTVAVKLHYDGTVNIDGTVTNLMPQTVTVKCNSLFESVDGSTAKIAYGRHLQNLDADTSGVTGITGAKQIRDINFAATVKNTTDTAIYYWGSTYPAPEENPDNGQDGFRNFHEIYNWDLTEYDGQDHEIRNMYIVSENVGGLFSMVMGGSYHNITIVNPHVHEAPAQTGGSSGPSFGCNIGALIGMANGDVKISECKVYVDYDPEKDTQDLKEQFERVFKEKLDSMTIDTTPNGNCYVKALLGFPHIEGTESNSSAGGLVGWSAGNISIQNSFCSIPVVGYTNAGGLVGLASNISISESYSAPFVYGCTYVGGLVGFANDIDEKIEIKNCYAAGEIMNGDPSSFNGAGLVNIGEDTLNEPDKIVVNTNYSAVKFVNATGEPKTGGGKEKQGTVYGTYNDDDSKTNYYIADPAVTEGYGNQVSGDTVSCGEEVTAAVLLENFKDKPEWTTGAGGKAFTLPYRLLKELDGLPDVYPYPMLTDTAGNVLPHYGDWLGETVSPSSLCYYEGYDGGEYGVWGCINPAGTLVNTLATGDTTDGDLEYATDDGYGVLVKDGETAPTVKVGSTEYSLSSSPIKENLEITVNGTANQYDLYEIKGLDSVSTTSYYNTITVGETDYWFNPFFACEVQKATPSDMNTPGAKVGAAGEGSSEDYNGKVVIRTARQLANMAAQTGSKGIDNPAPTASPLTPEQQAQQDAQLRDYEQLLDIDYSTYTGADLKFGKTSTNAQSPAALWKTGETANDTGSYHGHDFIIKNLYIKGNSSNIGLFGTLGTNKYGTIQHIKLVDVNIDGNGKDRVGALAGNVTNSTPIDNCGVYVSTADKYSGCAVTGGNYVGGLIGQVGGSTTVKNSFAAVKVEGKNCVGGFAGQINGSQGMENCYSGGHTENGEYKDTSINVTAESGSAGGFVGKLMNYQNDSSGKPNKANSFTLSGVLYSTCSVSGATDKTGLFAGEISDWTNLSGKTGGTAIEPVLSGITDYGLGTAFEKDGTGYKSTTPREETYLTTPTANTTPDFKTYPYDEALYEKDGAGATDWANPKPYPYVSGQTAHYGDWPVAKIEACFYWAKEGSGYEVYIVGFGGTTQLTNSAGENHLGELCATHHTVEDAMDTAKNATSNTDWGYGTIGLTDGLGTTLPTGVSVITAPAANLTTALKTALTGYSFEDTDVTVYTGATTGDTVTPVSSVAVSGQTYYLNLGFAAAISLDNNLGSSGNPYQIRNVRQLDNISNGSSTYKQTHDLYAGTSYTTSYTGASDFTGTYNGQSYRILELSIEPPDTVKNAALFDSVNGGTVENVILYSPSGGATITSTANGAANAAGIVGDLNGNATVHNCAVAGYTITVNNPSTSDSQCIGGIAGWVGSTAQITNCEAVVELVNNRTNGGGVNSNKATGAFMGGIAGEVSSNGSVKITNCYAGGTIKNEASTSAGG